MNRPTRRAVLKAAGALAAGAIAGLGTAPFFARYPRLVMVICIDCFRADQLSHIVNGNYVTPSLDRFAKDAVVFENAYANANWTKPSVASLFSGLWPTEHGVLKTVDTVGVVSGEGIAVPRGIETIAAKYAAAGYATAAFLFQPLLPAELGFARGFDIYRNCTYKAPHIENVFVDWHSRLPGNERAFVYLHFIDCHWPYVPTAEYRTMFGPTEEVLSPGFRLTAPSEWRALVEGVNCGRRTISGDLAVQLMSLYQGGARCVDVAISRILSYINSRDETRDSLVAVLADHGENFLEHGVLAHQPEHFYQEQTRIPLIIRFPSAWGIAPCRVAQDVQTIDLSATLAGVLGDGPFGHGRNLIPAARGASLASQPVITESEAGATVVSNGLKACVSWNGDEPVIRKVFNLKRDHGETTDVSLVYPNAIASLKSYLTRWREDAKETFAYLKTTSTPVSVSRENLDAIRGLGYVQ